MAVKKKKTAAKKTKKKTDGAAKVVGDVRLAPKTTKKMSAQSASKVDEFLVKISPALQNKVNHLVSVLEQSKESRLGDLTFLAGKILMRAQEISQGIKDLRKKRKS